jgi:hypothetical protein
MLHGSDRRSKAERYRKVAAEYKGLAEAADDQFLRSYYLRIANDYMERVDREARALLSEGSAALPGAANEPKLHLKGSTPRP